MLHNYLEVKGYKLTEIRSAEDELKSLNEELNKAEVKMTDQYSVVAKDKLSWEQAGGEYFNNPNVLNKLKVIIKKEKYRRNNLLLDTLTKGYN